MGAKWKLDDNGTAYEVFAVCVEPDDWPEHTDPKDSERAVVIERFSTSGAADQHMLLNKARYPGKLFVRRETVWIRDQPYREENYE